MIAHAVGRMNLNTSFDSTVGSRTFDSEYQQKEQRFALYHVIFAEFCKIQGVSWLHAWVMKL